MEEHDTTECVSDAPPEQGPRYICSKKRLLIWIGFVVACLEKCVNGSVFIFSVYSVAMKETFNYTQKEVELIASALNVGQGAAILPGMFYDRFGSRLTVAIGLFITSGSYFLIWSATKMVFFYKDKFYLFATFFFFGGFGSMFPHIAGFNTNVINFGENWTGKVIGIQDAFYGGSPIILSLLYYTLFSGGDGILERDQENFPGFMLLIAISYACAHGLCFIFLKVRINDDSSSEIAEKSVKPIEHIYQNGAFTPMEQIKNNHANIITQVETSKTTDKSDDEENIPFLRLLKKKHFHLYVWSLSCIAAVEVTYLNNLSISSKALGHTSRDEITIPLTMASCFVTSIACGILVDFFKNQRAYFIFVSSFMASTSLTIAAVLATNYGVFLTSGLLMTSSACCLWTVVPTEINDIYGKKQFGRNFGCLMLSHAVLGIGLQFLFGWFYDNSIANDDEIHCYGMPCVQNGYLLLLGLCALCLIVSVIVLVARRCRSKSANISVT